MPFPSRDEYERLLYTLPQRYPAIVSSTLHLYTTSRSTAIVRGSVHFRSGLELRIHEIVDFVAGCISDYSYTVFHGEERIRWYDPQPHPENLDLAETFPHHFHALPDIKHNRKPASGISFAEPNLPALIADCITLGHDLAGEPPVEGDQGPS